MVKELEHLLYEKRVREWGLIQLAKDKALEIPNSSLPETTKRLSSKKSQALHSGALWKNERQQT